MNGSIPPIVENLIHICKDDEAGFTAAAEAVKSADLKTLFQQCAEQRAQFARDLRREEAALGESHPPHSAPGHRGWMPIREVFVTRDEDAILAECEHGESAAVTAYREALEAPGLPDTMRNVIALQCDQVIAVHNRLRDLCDLLVTTH